MWNEPTQEELNRLPRLYATEALSLQDKIVHMHFFVGGCDWFVAEYDPQAQISFGFAILYGDMQNAEWGCCSLDELRAPRAPVPVYGESGKRLGALPMEVDRDLHWTPRKACEVEKIASACGWAPVTNSRKAGPPGAGSTDCHAVCAVCEVSFV